MLHGYEPSKKSKLRKQSLKKKVVKYNFDQVVLELKDLMEDSPGYKSDRIKSDLNWLIEEMEKGRFQASSLSSRELKAEIWDYEVYQK